MLKVGPAGRARGFSWDHQGKTEIAQIFISSNLHGIHSMHFVYVEDGRNVLSERIGTEGGITMNTITFDYPMEYVTRVSGEYFSSTSLTSTFSSTSLTSITFHTNKATYGPFGPKEPIYGLPFEPTVFNYEVGGKFYGFFGTYTSNGIESIGFYMKPIQTQANRLPVPQPNPPSVR